MKKTFVNVGGVKIPIGAECVECGRYFDLMQDNDADEYVNGHDCETGSPAWLFANQKQIIEGSIDEIADLL
jgi:predicted nucleic acid-binding Zn ribbon protein